MSKWTPGRWVVDGLAIRSGDGDMVAEAWSGIRADAVDATQLDRAEAQTANARLIASAPEMAEELAHLLALIEPAIESGVTIPGLATMNRARALLARLEADK